MKKLYRPRTGSRITKTQAQFIGEVAERDVGRPSKEVAAALVKASRASDAPTRGLFRGTNADKARRWDIVVALRLLGDVVEYSVSTDPNVDARRWPRHEVRAFTHLPATRDEPSVCVNTNAAAMDEALRDRLIEETRRRLASARMFAAGIKELVEIVDGALGQVDKLKASRRKRKTG